MPYLNVVTNTVVDHSKAVVKELSQLCATVTGKPESYIMVFLNDQQNVAFGGSFEPAAFIEFKSIGLPEKDTKMISEKICDFMSQKLQIPSARVYIEFASAKGTMWGWNGGTF